MVSLFFARHAQTDWNQQGRTQGEIDIPLNARGVEQARSLRALLQPLPIKQVICSSLKRASRTAELAVEGLPYPVYPNQHWREFSVDEQHALTVNNSDSQNLKQMRTDSAIKAQWLVLHRQNIDSLLVSHGAVFESLCRSLQMPVIEIANASIWQIYRRDQQWAYRTIFSGFEV